MSNEGPHWSKGASIVALKQVLECVLFGAQPSSSVFSTPLVQLTYDPSVSLLSEGCVCVYVRSSLRGVCVYGRSSEVCVCVCQELSEGCVCVSGAL